MSEFGRLSLLRDSADFDETQAREHGARLELRAQAESEVAVRDEYVGLLAPAPGQRVLDVGCGSGAVTRALARRVVPGGRVVALDTSAALLGFARELAEKSGIAECIEFRVGNCCALAFPDTSFDCVLAATTLSHIPEAETALAEMVRVTRPGGRIGVFDLDADLTLYTHPDREITRRVIAAHSDFGWANSIFVRRVPSLMPSLGIVDVKVKSFMSLESGGYYAARAARAAETAATGGAITSEEKAHWLDALHEEIAAKRFLGGQLHLFVWGTRAM